MSSELNTLMFKFTAYFGKLYVSNNYDAFYEVNMLKVDYFVFILCCTIFFFFDKYFRLFHHKTLLIKPNETLVLLFPYITY